MCRRLARRCGCRTSLSSWLTVPSRCPRGARRHHLLAELLDDRRHLDGHGLTTAPKRAISHLLVRLVAISTLQHDSPKLNGQIMRTCVSSRRDPAVDSSRACSGPRRRTGGARRRRRSVWPASGPSHARFVRRTGRPFVVTFPKQRRHREQHHRKEEHDTEIHRRWPEHRVRPSRRGRRIGSSEASPKARVPLTSCTIYGSAPRPWLQTLRNHLHHINQSSARITARSRHSRHSAAPDGPSSRCAPRMTTWCRSRSRFGSEACVLGRGPENG